MDFKDYKPWVQTKLSPKFHPDPEDEQESELRTIIEDFIEVGNKLDILKKNKFYGRVKGHPKHVESGVEVRPSDSNFRKESEDEQLLHAIIGMATETVEMLEAIHASKWKEEEFDTVNLFEEMGDLEFYRSILFNNLDWTEDGVRDTNYFKLEKRYPVGYTDKDATERDLESERTILEDGLGKEKFIYVAVTSFDAFRGIKISSKFKKLMQEIEASSDELIEGIFEDYDEYRTFEVECSSQARHGSNGTEEYSLDTSVETIVSDNWNFEQKELDQFPSYEKLLSGA